MKSRFGYDLDIIVSKRVLGGVTQVFHQISSHKGFVFCVSTAPGAALDFQEVPELRFINPIKVDIKLCTLE